MSTLTSKINGRPTSGIVYTGIRSAAEIIAKLNKVSDFYRNAALAVLAGKATPDDCEDIIACVHTYKLDVEVSKIIR